MRVLVCGAAGHAGGHLVARLRAQGDDVVAAGHDAEEVVDFRVPDDVHALVRACAPDAVVQLAGPASAAAMALDPLEGNGNVVQPCVHVMEAAVQHAPRARLLLVTGHAVYGRAHRLPMDEAHPRAPSDGFGAAKAAVEYMAQGYVARGLDVVIARPFPYTGPPAAPEARGAWADGEVARWALAGVRGEPTCEVAAPARRIDLSDVRDVVEGYVCLLARGARGEAYNLCSGAAVSVEELFAEAAPGVGLLPAEGTSSAPVVLGDASRARALGWTPAHARAETLRDLRAALAGRVHARHG